MKTLDVTPDEAKVLIEVLGAAPERGYSIAEIRSILRVIDALGGQAPLQLEDADYAALWQRYEQVKWMRADPKFVILYDKIVAAGKGTS